MLAIRKLFHRKYIIDAKVKSNIILKAENKLVYL